LRRIRGQRRPLLLLRLQLNAVRVLLAKWSVSQIMSGLRCGLLGGVVASEQLLVGCNSLQQISEFIASELPREWLRMSIAQLFVKCKPHANGIQIGEVVRSEYFALDDGEVDLHLVEPTGMNRRMNQNDPRIHVPQTFAGRLTSMRRTVVHDPEQAFRRTVGFLGEYLGHQSTKRFNACRRFTASHDITTANVPSGQVLQRAVSFIFAFHALGSFPSRLQWWMDTAASLNAGLLVGTDDKVLVFQGFSLPMASVQVEDWPRLFQELRVSREDPVLVSPGPDGILDEDAPHAAAADGLFQCPSRSPREIRQGLPAEGFPRLRNTLACQRLDQSMIPRGKNRPYGRAPRHPPARSLPPPTAYASDEPVGQRAPPAGRVVLGPTQDGHEPAAPVGTAARNDGTLSCGVPLFSPLPRTAPGTTDRKLDADRPWHSSSPWTCRDILIRKGIIPHYALEP